MASKELAMLDFTSDGLNGTLPSQAAQQPPVNDQALLDAYSNAVIDVIDRVGPGVGRGECAPRPMLPASIPTLISRSCAPTARVTCAMPRSAIPRPCAAASSWSQSATR